MARRTSQQMSTIATLLLICTIQYVFPQEYLPPKMGGKNGASEPSQPANYEYSYNVQETDANLDFGHEEKRKEDLATGSYHVLLPDGRTQLVEYEAGPAGYNPQVMYMGTATFPANDKSEGYHYRAASNRHSVRQPAPRAAVRPAPTPAAVLPVPAPAPSLATAPASDSTA